MASKRYKKVLLFRFFAYLSILSGFTIALLIAEPVVFSEFNYRKNQLLGIKYSLGTTTVVTSSGEVEETPPPTNESGPGFSSLGSSNEEIIKPVSTEYGIVIEKINANAKVIPQVDPSKEGEYVKALLSGVAEAKGSTEPGQPGNVYLFSHSTDAPWNIVRYNAIFYLLRELEKGDRIVVFYKGRRYNYIVFDKTITKPSDLTFLANRYDKPVLTLQTCDPPGTLINRLVVRAQLENTAVQ